MYYFTIILVLCQYSFSLFHLYYTTKLRNKTKNAIKLYIFVIYRIMVELIFKKRARFELAFWWAIFRGIFVNLSRIFLVAGKVIRVQRLDR